MINNSKKQNSINFGEIEEYCIAVPTYELKKRVLQAASEMWCVQDEGSPDIAWQRPVLRLAASLIVAFLLIFFTNISNNNFYAGKQKKYQISVYDDLFPEFYSQEKERMMLFRVLAATATSLPKKNISEILLSRLQQTQKMLMTATGKDIL